MAVIIEDFKKAMSHFCTGVTIVTFTDGDEPYGLTVNAFSSLSLDPPLVLICIGKQTSSHDFLVRTDAFVVNILRKEQEALALRFARWELNNRERFESTRYQLAENGMPVLEGNLAHLVCTRNSQLEGGDHTILVGEVEATAISESGEPLVYYQSRFQELKNL